MITIKRYANRKLYNTKTRQYINIDGLRELIRHGAEVEVIDHETGEDLTAMILAQIIYEQEKKTGGTLPLSVLSQLIQNSGSTVKAVRNAIGNPVELARYVNTELEKRIENLVNRDEMSHEEGDQLLTKMMKMGQDVMSQMSGEKSRSEASEAAKPKPSAEPAAPRASTTAAKTEAAPSREEIDGLQDKVDALSDQIRVLTELLVNREK